ncbi:hypothetical protein MEQU1_001400 [Malassezia equina]|uniref:Uncharacterized protein n=1 Tax=Malassezia equina TaxID=1381935 RepID=A0AAF0ECZ6_9BASI|nr:hypothetical protein MEQU1_001400 [Malassezia equina]
MAEQAAALAWALRLRALASHLGVESNEQDLPIQSRIAQIEQSITQVLLAQEQEDLDAQMAIVLDSEEGMRSFLETMEACRALDDQGIAGAGDLTCISCESEQATQREHLQALEGRVYTFLEQYGNYVDQLSRIFIALDAAVRQLEAAPAS